MEGVDEIKDLIKKGMMKQGIPLEEGDEGNEGSKKASEEEPKGSKKTTKEGEPHVNGGHAREQRRCRQHSKAMTH